jgi:methanethiol S-methyltransferase
MARRWFKERVLSVMPEAFVRCTYVHMANLCLFALIHFWQPIPIDVWDVGRGIVGDSTWILFAIGWLILFLGAWSFGIFELLGLQQMRAWSRGIAVYQPRLKTGRIYRWLRHPMYVGVLLGVWATPRRPSAIFCWPWASRSMFSLLCATRSVIFWRAMVRATRGGARPRHQGR